MNMQFFRNSVEKHRAKILEVEQYIWAHPESGYREWNTTHYLEAIFEEAGYTLTRAGDIPGFYTDIETGRPGPKLLIMAELDALVSPTHHAAWNECAHACGHHAQCAAMVGIALALKEPGVLDELSGSIRLMLVPAEELIEIEYRKSLCKQGLIHYLGGKVEFMYRGYMDGVDLGFLFHTDIYQGKVICCGAGSNGCITKDITYTGAAAHAGSSPHEGINALYAATLGMQCINSLRETFRDNDHVRVHPIVTEGGQSVNIIPSTVRLSSYVRGASMDAIIDANRKVNRALAGTALAMGCKVEISDLVGFAPLNNSHEMLKITKECLGELYGEDQVDFHGPWVTGCTDMGDLSTVFPVVQPFACGASGKNHGDDYCISDPEKACVQSAVSQVWLAVNLLSNGAAKARHVVESYQPLYASKEEYFEAVGQLTADKALVRYNEDGSVQVTY